MESRPNVLEAAMATGVIRCPAQSGGEEADWNNAAPRIKRFLKQSNGRVTLFLGSAISSFKPAQLPMWDQFIELLWTALMRNGVKALRNSEELQAGFMAFFEDVKKLIPNYLVTEIISRRLGKQYLELLEAFAAQRLADGAWAVNEIHKWTARCLALGEVAAVVTTNFDDYLEKALDVVEANWYKVTGQPHKDGDEISARLPLTSSSQKLVLVVNGAKSFSFVRSLMPQLGAGKITFLFKIHGSCYDPTSCIDTRLQRSQGLPSYSTDVLDTLLRRTTWVVAGFSGSDMNDNLDYLRIRSNKKHATVVWLEYPGGYRERALENLTTELDRDSQSSIGLCLLNGFFVGERTSARDKFPGFESKVMAWAERLTNDWCKLVMIDLVILLEGRAGKRADPKLLESLNEGTAPRQDWNDILSKMELQDQQSQVVPARVCCDVWTMLYETLELDERSGTDIRTEYCHRLNSGLKEITRQNVEFESAALAAPNALPHAQAWVLSALGGLIMLCGGEVEAAAQAFEMSSGLAWLVGDFKSHQLLENTISFVQSNQHASGTTESKNQNTPETATSYIAFTPAIDNVNSKMNRFGVPPANYIRALLHRSILFSDGMAVPTNIIVNSSVFVDEVLFQGEKNVLNTTYIQHVFPMIPVTFKQSSQKLHNYRRSRATSYMAEPVDENHLQRLDEYFDMAEHANQILYYDEDRVKKDYGRFFRKQVEHDHVEDTVRHLVELWNRLEPTGLRDELQQDADHSRVAQETAQDLVETLGKLSVHLPEDIYRSSLYKFADLFDEASEPESVLGHLRHDITEQEKAEIISARRRIVEKPWRYGPFCHEIFDAPYITNLPFNLVSTSGRNTFLFLEDEELPLWQFMSAIRRGSRASVQPTSSAVSSSNLKYSSLLLSQAPESVLIKAKEALSPIRAKFTSGSQLLDEDKAVTRSIMAKFQKGSLALPDVDIKDVVIPNPDLRAAAYALLQQCIFLVRSGPPLDPMYEEAHLTIPGLLVLARD